jgi:hypothetical protein
LLVDGSEPRLSRKFRDTLRMHIYHMKKHGVQAHADRRGFGSVSGLYRHVKGLLDYAKSIDQSYWQKNVERVRGNCMAQPMAGRWWCLGIAQKPNFPTSPEASELVI